MKPIFIVGNLIWILIEESEYYKSKDPLYMLCGRNGGLVLNALMTGEQLVNRFPKGEFREGINVSDNITFNDK